MGSRSSGGFVTAPPGPADKEQPAPASPAALASRADFRLGPVLVRPSLRVVEGNGASATVEPRIMQVLLVLADAQGAVVPRDDLLRLCWPGVVVGDDSLNRAIAELRRAVRAVDDKVKVETIPKVGYRLLAEAPTPSVPGGDPAPTDDRADGRGVPVVNRRALLGGGAAIAAALGLWLTIREEHDPRLAGLVDRGRGALLDSLPRSDLEAVRLFREAAAIAPDDAAVWGWLALGLSTTAARSPPERAAAAFRQSEEAARRALALDPAEANALAALVSVREQLESWFVREESYRAILAAAPDNVAALNGLTGLLQAVGRCRESRDANERAAALEPMATINQQRRALKHWIFGRPADADRIIDGALQRRPRHPLLWNARLLIYAFTGRPRAAMALLDNAQTRPAEETPAALSVWRASLAALETRTSGDIAAARAANLDAATRSHGAAANAVMILSELGELDVAFAVAEGFLLRRGRVLGPLGGASGQPLAQDPRWRSTQWLFTPATRNFRADRRFGGFCADIGLADYWRRRGIGPDDVESLSGR